MNAGEAVKVCLLLASIAMSVAALLMSSRAAGYARRAEAAHARAAAAARRAEAAHERAAELTHGQQPREEQR